MDAGISRSMPEDRLAFDIELEVPRCMPTGGPTVEAAIADRGSDDLSGVVKRKVRLLIYFKGTDVRHFINAEAGARRADCSEFASLRK